MKRNVLAYLLLGVVFKAILAPLHSASFLKPKYSAIVIDANTQEVMYAYNADDPAHPASITKIMSLYMVFKALKEKKISFNDFWPVSKHAQNQEPSKLGLKAGQLISVKDVVMSMITKSANDGSVVAAEALSGSETKFAELMTQEARRLGMNGTTFKCASGLPHPENITTARDMALLSVAMLRKFPEFYPLFKTKHFLYGGVRHPNHNKLLGVSGIDGIKNGWTIASGSTLVASAERSGKRVIAVILGAPSWMWRDKQMLNLINVSFNRLGLGEGSVEYAEPQLNLSPKKKRQKLDYLVHSLEKPHVVQSQKISNLKKKVVTRKPKRSKRKKNSKV